jgi:hypothetical protein
MADNLDILNTAVSLLIKAALLTARFSARVRQRSLKRLASRDVDAKAKEILFLKDREPATHGFSVHSSARKCSIYKGL